MRELRSTEEIITGKKQEIGTDCEIDLQNIYDAIRYLKPEQQGIILSTYKLTDLGSILTDRKNYEKYIADLLQGATVYINTVGALAALRKEAVKDSEKNKEFDIWETMIQVYDSLPEEYKKVFCMNLLDRKEFFEDACKVMMNSFQSAVEVVSNDVGSGVVNEKVEK